MNRLWISAKSITENNCQTLMNSGAKVTRYPYSTVIEIHTIEQEQLLKIMIPDARPMNIDYNI